MIFIVSPLITFLLILESEKNNNYEMENQNVFDTHIYFP